jgi:U-box domain
LSSLKSTKFQVFIKCIGPEKNEILRKIGDLSLNDEQQGFCLSSDDRRTFIDESLKTESIYPYARKSLKGIDEVQIVIQDTRLRRAPVIKKVEVWGFPSARNSPSDVDLIHRLWNPTKPKEVLKIPAINSPEISFNIPDEFNDAITQDLLVMPFVLPSGNVIDETTLEKHKRHEESYGRLPSDPFTGLVYTPDTQPKFDSALKVRLDEFKMRNSHEIEIKQSGRTLGKKHEDPVPSSSGYNATNGHISKKIKLSESSSDLDTLINEIYKNNQVSIFTKPKDTRIEENRWKCCQENSLNFYRITSCNHVFCKTCLIKLKEVCRNCEKSFESKNVIKINQ